MDCTRCGSCNAVCPVYDLTRHERFSPRGKARLFSDIVRGGGSNGLSSRDTKLFETLGACLQCGACSYVCPAGVEVDSNVRKLRQANSLPGPGLPYGLLKRPRLLSGLAQFFFMLPGRSGLMCRLSGLLDAFSSGEAASFIMSQISSRPAISRGLEGVGRRLGYLEGGPRPAFFLGCIQNYIYPEIAEAIARHLGPRLIAPAGQTCCGLPAWSSGLKDDARALALINIKAMQEVDCDVIVTGCASCASMIRRWPELFDDGREKEAAIKIASMVSEFSDFISKSKHVPAISSRYAGLSMTYHAPCHQRFILGGSGAAKALLQQAAPGEFIPVPEGCCGHGGVFSLKHAGLSRAILKKRLDAVKDNGVDLIVTTCSGCLLQFRSAVPVDGGLKAVHIAEFLSFKT
ncbi:MAG: (Fe-S)-binding protein [Desulfobacteraceae bacterium]|nr:(Fe-S)-binding protein [Desulfobacteraceae bacterium]